MRQADGPVQVSTDAVGAAMSHDAMHPIQDPAIRLAPVEL
jgi:hypothetical protein